MGRREDRKKGKGDVAFLRKNWRYGFEETEDLSVWHTVPYTVSLPALYDVDDDADGLGDG